MSLIRPSFKPFKNNLIMALSQWKCLLLTILIDLCIISMCWCKLSLESSNKNYFKLPLCHNDYLYIPSAFLILFYFIYLIECWKCHLRLELSHPIDVQSAYTYLSQLKNLKPELFWKVSSFHYTRNDHSLNNFNQENNNTVCEKVVTDIGFGEFKMRNLSIVDKTPKPIDLDRFLLTQLHIQKNIKFESITIEDIYKEEKCSFIQPFQLKDDFVEVIDGMKSFNNSKCSTLLITNHKRRQPFLISNRLHIICAVTLLSWPLRLIIICNTAHLYYHCEKSIEPKRNDIDRESISSNEEINNLPPSYSEALKLCEPKVEEQSTVYCNQNRMSSDQNLSSEESMYSMKLDFENKLNWNKERFSENGISQYLNNWITSVRRIIVTYGSSEKWIRRSRTFSLNNITENTSFFKRDISMPINILSRDI